MPVFGQRLVNAMLVYIQPYRCSVAGTKRLMPFTVRRAGARGIAFNTL